MVNLIRNIYRPLLLIAILTLAGCTTRHTTRHDSRLDIPDSLMNSHPDSVLVQLSNIDPADLPSSYDRALHTLFLTIAADKCYKPVPPDSVLIAAAECFHREKDILNEAKARYYAGWALCQASDYQGAIWQALNTIDLAHAAADTFWMGRAHDLASEIYMLTYDSHNAEIEAAKAIEYFKKAGAISFANDAHLTRVRAMITPDLTSGDSISNYVSELLDSLIHTAIINKDSIFAADCMIQKAFLYYKLGKYSPSEQVLDSMLRFNDEPMMVRNSMSMRIGIAASKGKTMKLSDDFSNFVPSSRQDSIYKLSVEEKYAASEQNWQRAYQISDSLSQFSAKILGDRTYKSTEEIRDRYNRALLEKQKEETAHLRTVSISIIIFIILLLIISLLTILLIRRRNKRLQEKIMDELLDLANDNEYMKGEVGVMRQRIKESEELTKINKEKMLENFQKRDEILGNWIDAVCDLVMEYYGESTSSTSKNALYHKAVSEIKRLKSDRTIKELEQSIDELHHDVLSKMQECFPRIMKDNHRWIAMMISGLQPKTISFLLDMKLQTLYVKRNRVRSYIEKSDIPDKDAFLRYFPGRK